MANWHRSEIIRFWLFQSEFYAASGEISGNFGTGIINFGTNLDILIGIYAASGKILGILYAGCKLMRVTVPNFARRANIRTLDFSQEFTMRKDLTVLRAL